MRMRGGGTMQRTAYYVWIMQIFDAHKPDNEAQVTMEYRVRPTERTDRGNTGPETGSPDMVI